MKSARILFFPLLLFFIGSMACKTDNSIILDMTGADSSDDTIGRRLRVKVGSRTFTATLLDNATVTAFKARLPLTVSMSDLNSNEKFYRFSKDLPTSASNLGTIQAGDLMIYSSNTLVLFYDTFRTSYSYTKLGRIDNPSGLIAALGSEDVTVGFELEP